MNSVVWLYALFITSILSFLYTLVMQDWFAAFVTLILWILIGVWFLLKLKGVKRSEKS